MSKHVLFLSYDGMTDPLGQSQVLSYLEGLTKKGYIFHLISFEKPKLFKEHQNYISSLCNKAGIHWYPHVYTKRPPVISTLRDVRKMRKKAYKLQEKYDIKLIHCRSYIPAIIGLRLKNQRNCKLLFDMRGFWANERVEGNIWNIKNPVFKNIYNYFKRKEIQFFAFSDHTISLTENGKEEILSWSKLQANKPKITVIPCCADLEKFNPNAIEVNRQTEIRKELNIKTTDFVLGYVGSIGTWYMLPEMMQYYKEIREGKTNPKFLFISGENPNNILQEAKKQGIPENEIIVKSVLHKDVATCISIFTFSIFFIRPTFSKKASSPVKQGEIMAMGIPVICNSGVGDTDRIVLDSNAGIVLENFKPETFKKNEINLSNFDAEHIRYKAKQYFSLENGVYKYHEVYKELIE